MRYVYQVVFGGNRGCSFRPYDRLWVRKSEAYDAMRRWDGSGLRYGASVKRVTVAPHQYAEIAND